MTTRRTPIDNRLIFTTRRVSAVRGVGWLAVRRAQRHSRRRETTNAGPRERPPRGAQGREKTRLTGPYRALLGGGGGGGSVNCDLSYVPVCGCDGQTYGNACAAHVACQGVLSEGECSP